ncbi:MAG: Holliday junction resolvase RuvX [Deltaproteobacteria bacterium]|nr:Holliday junction resolvase RuvX [Deltaproteobacteria bacterium]
MAGQHCSGRVAALDLGKVRVGLAISDELGLFAHPRPALDGRHRPALLAALALLAAEEGVATFLVGLPLDLSGRQGPAARRAARFAADLAAATGLCVRLVDERLTTVQATRELRAAGASRRRIGQRVDGAAAALILQQWLDGQGGTGAG